MPNSTDFIFSIEPSTTFRIDVRSGEMKLNMMLDRETIDSYKIKVNVKDPEIAGTRLETSKDCVIRVLDVNDNKPDFKPSMTQFKMLPIVNEKTLVGYFGATDADLGLNSTIDYFILNDFDRIFEVDQDGHLYLNLRRTTSKNVDLLDSYEVALVARDRGTPTSLESTLLLGIKIDPSYFNFNQNKSSILDLEGPDLVNLEENSAPGTLVGEVKVLNSFKSIMDETAANSLNRTVDLTFSLLTCKDTFAIDTLSGVIKVADSSRLDYEREKEFVLVVEAREVQQMQTFSKLRTGQTR